MQIAHHRPDEAFDVAAEVRRLRRSKGEGDYILAASSFKRLAMKFLRVVEMNNLR